MQFFFSVFEFQTYLVLMIVDIFLTSAQAAAWNRRSWLCDQAPSSGLVTRLRGPIPLIGRTTNRDVLPPL